VRDSTITQPITGMIVNTANVFQSYNGTSWASPASAYGDSQVTALIGNFGANLYSSTGNITTTGNITGGNLLTGGDVVPDGNVTMGTGNITSQSGNIVTTSGNISGGNIITGGIVSATGNVSGATVTATNSVKMAVYADDAARNTGIPSPIAGQMVFKTDIAKLQFYNGSAWETVTSAV
jgi:hypothetical protein